MLTDVKKLLFWSAFGFLVLVVLLNVLTLGLTLWQEGWYDQGENAAMVQETVSEQGLIARAWLSSTRVKPGEQVDLEVTFENHTGGPVEIRFLKFACPGFSAEGIPPGSQPIQLGKDKTEAVTARLTALDRLGKYKLTSIFSWKGNASGPRQASLSLGPLTVASPLPEELLALKKPAEILSKDLTLPLAIFILTFWFQQNDKKRTETQQTWSQILPLSHDYASKHYLPMLSALRKLRKEAGTNWNLFYEPESRRRCLYYLLLFLRRKRHSESTIGGFFFKDREGELNAARAWRVFQERLYKALDQTLLEQVVPRLSLEENLGTFLAEFQKKPHWVDEKLAQVEERFRVWCRECVFQRDVGALYIFEPILRYEANRPYDQWYGTPREFDDDRSFPEGLLRLWPRGARQLPENMKETNQMEEFRRDLIRYRRRTEWQTQPALRWLWRRIHENREERSWKRKEQKDSWAQLPGST